MKIEIIAELAQGFEGNFEQAKLLVKAAATAGADAAKYQLIYAEEMASQDYKYYDLFCSLEMVDDAWFRLSDEASKQGVKLYLDIFGDRSLRLAERIGVDAVKLHGTDISNIDLLQRVAESKVSRVFLGAGGALSDELEKAIDILSEKIIVVMLGFQGYPTFDDCNQIDRIRLLRDRYSDYPSITIGFADHATPESSMRYALPAVAVGAGAMVIEKHLTLGRNMKLEDYESALNPDEFLEFVKIIQDCASSIGVASDAVDFGMSDAEHIYRKSIRRHVVARCHIPKGKSITYSDVLLKRTSAESPVTELTKVYGRKSPRAIDAGSPLLEEDFN